MVHFENTKDNFQLAHACISIFAFTVVFFFIFIGRLCPINVRMHSYLVMLEAEYLVCVNFVHAINEIFDVCAGLYVPLPFAF